MNVQKRAAEGAPASKAERFLYWLRTRRVLRYGALYGEARPIEGLMIFIGYYFTACLIWVALTSWLRIWSPWDAPSPCDCIEGVIRLYDPSGEFSYLKGFIPAGYTILEVAGITFAHALAASIIGSLVGIASAAWFVSSDRTSLLYRSHVFLLNATPILVYLGIVQNRPWNDHAKVIVVTALVAFYFAARATITAIADEEKQAVIDAARSDGSDRGQVLRYISVPYSRDAIMSGVQAAITSAMRYVLFIEAYLASPGLGVVVQDLFNFRQGRETCAAIVIAVLCSVVIYGLTLWMSRSKQSVQGP